MKADVIVLGAGMVGVSAALQIQAMGRDVVLVDRRPASDETSYGNAGIIQREGVVPYMFPRDIRKMITYALNRSPEANIHYRALPVTLPWLVRYFLASSEAGRERGAAAALPLIERCLDEHKALMDASGTTGLLRETGYLKLYRDDKLLDDDLGEQEEVRARYEVPFEVCNNGRIRELEPHLAGDFAGAILLSSPASVSDPGALGKAYAELFRARGGRFVTADARTLARTGATWTVQTVDGAIAARDAVVALGPWSGDLLRALGVGVPLGGKRGYHMHYRPRGNATLTRPVIDVDNGYVLAPMTRGIRLTTGAEFARRDAPLTPVQLTKVEPVARGLFPIAERAEAVPWMGVRPCLPDMIPMIGRVPRHPGLWANFGHHHLGLTLGPVSGRLIAELIAGQAPFTDPAPYRVDRF